MKLLDQEIVAKISNLKFRAKSVVEGVLSGLHSSPYKGHSLEFAQHRQYSNGDELRHIDWKVYGRSDKFFVKQFQDETNLRAHILLDSSKSMAYKSSVDMTKLEYAANLATAFSYLLLRQEDAVSVAAFNEDIRFFLPARNVISHLSLIVEKLEMLEGEGGTDIEKVLSSFGAHLKKRGLVIVISDLLSDSEKVMRALKAIRFRHHEVKVIQVLDKNEVDFDFYGENNFVNMENKTNVSVDADAIKQEYKKIFERFLEEYKICFRQSGISYHVLTTDMPLELSLSECLK